MDKINKIPSVLVALIFFLIAFLSGKEMPWACEQEKDVKIVKVEYDFHKVDNPRESLRKWEKVSESRATTTIFYENDGKYSETPVVFNKYVEIKEGTTQKLPVPSSCSDGYFPWSHYTPIALEVLFGFLILSATFI